MQAGHRMSLRPPIIRLHSFAWLERSVEIELTLPSLTKTDPIRSSVSPILPAGGIARSSTISLVLPTTCRPGGMMDKGPTGDMDIPIRRSCSGFKLYSLAFT